MALLVLRQIYVPKLYEDGKLLINTSFIIVAFLNRVISTNGSTLGRISTIYANNDVRLVSETFS